MTLGSSISVLYHMHTFSHFHFQHKCPFGEKIFILFASKSALLFGNEIIAPARDMSQIQNIKISSMKIFKWARGAWSWDNINNLIMIRRKRKWHLFTVPNYRHHGFTLVFSTEYFHIFFFLFFYPFERIPYCWQSQYIKMKCTYA